MNIKPNIQEAKTQYNIPVIRTNPEHQRLTWLYSGAGTLCLVVAAYLLPVAVTAMGAEKKETVWLTALVIGSSGINVSFIALLIMMARSLRSDFHNRFWDQLRMSSLSPWQVLWPRLFSAPLPAWLGLVIGSVLLWLGSIYSDSSDSGASSFIIWKIPSLLLSALIAASWLLMSSLQQDRRSTEWRGSVAQVFLMFVLLGGWSALSGVWVFGSVFDDIMQLEYEGGVDGFTLQLYSNGLLLLCAALSVLCAWRVMANKLHLVPVNLFWLVVVLLFPVILSVYQQAWFPQIKSAFLPLAASVYGTAALLSLCTQTVRPIPRNTGLLDKLQHMPVWYVMLPLTVVLVMLVGSENTMLGKAGMGGFKDHLVIFETVYLLLFAGCNVVLSNSTKRFSAPVVSMLVFGVLYTTFCIGYVASVN